MAHDEFSKSIRPEESTPSDFSTDSTSTYVASPEPLASVHHRPTYQRVPTMQEEDISYHGAARGNEPDGLGIHDLKAATQGPSIEISFSGDDSPAPPPSDGYLLSPSLSRSSKKYQSLGNSPEDEEAFDSDGRSRSPSLYRPFTADSETETLRRVRPRASSTLSPYGPTGIVIYFMLERIVSRNSRSKGQRRQRPRAVT